MLSYLTLEILLRAREPFVVLYNQLAKRKFRTLVLFKTFIVEIEKTWWF